MSYLPATTCPACWQRRDVEALHYCSACTAEFTREYDIRHPAHPVGPAACEDTTCPQCFAQTGDNDHDDFPEEDDEDE